MTHDEIEDRINEGILMSDIDKILEEIESKGASPYDFWFFGPDFEIRVNEEFKGETYTPPDLTPDMLQSLDKLGMTPFNGGIRARESNRLMTFYHNNDTVIYHHTMHNLEPEVKGGSTTHSFHIQMSISYYQGKISIDDTEEIQDCNNENCVFPGLPLKFQNEATSMYFEQQ